MKESAIRKALMPTENLVEIRSNLIYIIYIKQSTDEKEKKTNMQLTGIIFSH